MNHFQHPSNNAVFGAPTGWDQKELPCDALPVTRTTFGGQPCIESYWRPSEADLAALNADGYVVLSILGNSMPPVAMRVEA